MKPITEYKDYRKFMQDFYDERKRTGAFSWREFSKLAGFASPTYLKLVCEGKSGLSKVKMKQVSKAMGLTGYEEEYFSLLVVLAKATKDADKKEALLSSLREVFVHVGPFVVLAVGGSLRVGSGVADTVEFLEPQLGVFLFVVGGLQEQFGDLFVTFLLCAAGEVGVLVAGLGFTCEGGLEILFGLSSGVLVCHSFLFVLRVPRNPVLCLCPVNVDFFRGKN